MSSSIYYRQLEGKDFKILTKILSSTWQLNEYSKNKKITKLIARYDFLNYLCKSNYSLISSVNGKPVGVLLARNEKKYNIFSQFFNKIKKAFLWIRLIFLSSGRKYLKENKIMAKADKKLRKNHHRRYGAEFVLFAVKKNYKGQGVGSEMLDIFIKYLNDNKINTYYLYTDEYCNVDYYIKHDFTKLDETDVMFDGDKEPSTFYIFSYNINKHLTQQNKNLTSKPAESK